MELRKCSMSAEVTSALFTATYFAEQGDVEVSLKELLAGIYVGCFERVLACCAEPAELVRFAVEKLELEEPVWRYWFAIERQSDSDKEDTLTTFTAEAVTVLERAALIAGKHAVEGERPLVRLEHVLAAISESRQFELCNEFVNAGLKLE